MSTTTELLTVGIKHHQAGRFNRAEDAYQQVLRTDPDHADALHLLGVMAHQAGRHQAAVEKIRRAIASNPQSAAFHSNLALAYKALGKLEEAAGSCRRALECNPCFVEAHNNLGNILRMQGRPDEAVASYRWALQVKPGYAEAHNNLGIALKELRQFEEAAVHFQRAVELKPDYAEAHNNLGSVLLHQNKLEQAEASFRRAIALEPDHAPAHNNLANVLKTTGQVEEAETAYLRSLELAPRNPEALGNLASLYERVNRLEDAAAALEKGLEIFPDNPGINLMAARCEEREGRYQDAIDRLVRIGSFVRPNAKLSFQLARLYDRIGDYPKAFWEFSQANRSAREEVPYGAPRKETFLKNIDTFETLFTDAWIRSWTPAPQFDENRTPVFVIGFPRSGTTLLDVILDSHPRIRTLEEKPAISAMYEALDTFPHELMDAIPDLTPAQFDRLRAAYFRTAERFVDRRAGEILVDKLPLNTIHVGFILRVFPSARFIMAVRHPCDVCLSCFMQDFKLNIAMANFCTLEDAARAYRRVMDLWQQYVRVLPHSCHLVRYEDLIEDFQTETRRVLEFLNVDWNDAVLDYANHAKGRGKINTPSYEQVIQPIYTRSRYRWLRYAEQFEPVMDLLAPYIEFFGYATPDDDPP
jgi:tetratricopeptide (TPR) repeat protein